MQYFDTTEVEGKYNLKLKKHEPHPKRSFAALVKNQTEAMRVKMEEHPEKHPKSEIADVEKESLNINSNFEKSNSTTEPVKGICYS